MNNYQGYLPDKKIITPRIFKNDVLERFTLVHHLAPLFIYGPISLALFFRGLYLNHWLIDGVGALSGYVIWTLLEYFGHRYIFHLRLPGALGARLQFLIHGVHHDYPNDPFRLVMPPLMSMPIILMGYAVIRFLCGPNLVWPVLSGFVAGYLAYDMIHYHVHLGVVRTRAGEVLKRRHMLHHFHDERRGFGVSAPWWDDVLGTKPRL
jgi:sterol desaturase/sphingolipid hydroxylase (fatty acid hydroxylase superfamily)